jgi:hypothetical protein
LFSRLQVQPARHAAVGRRRLFQQQHVGARPRDDALARDCSAPGWFHPRCVSRPLAQPARLRRRGGAPCYKDYPGAGGRIPGCGRNVVSVAFLFLFFFFCAHDDAAGGGLGCGLGGLRTAGAFARTSSHTASDLCFALFLVVLLLRSCSCSDQITTTTHLRSTRSCCFSCLCLCAACPRG